MRVIALLMILLSPLPAMAQRSLHMSIGDQARRDREAKVVLDAVTDTATGEILTPHDAIARLSGVNLIFLGESHTSMDFHRVQKRVIEELERSGRKVIIGLEMYPYTEQKYLDDWCQGFLTENGFVQLSHWYGNWGYHWNYYREIFLFARDHGIRLFAVNTPREVVTAVRRKGFQNLTPEEAAHIPTKIDTANEDHFSLFKAFFEEETGMHSSMDDKMARAMFDAQCTWDATMGFNSVRALKEHGGKDTVMVVLIGSGHVAYGLGIERQAAQWYDGRMASLIPIQVVDQKNRKIESVRASYADFLWGLPQEKDALYPELGLSTGEFPGDGKRRVLSVEDDSVAKASGFKEGDILLSMDGLTLNDRELLNRLLAEKNWGDSAMFTIRRGDQEMQLRVLFRRQETPKPASQPPK
jgi:uncharacterized iron-regulated protein